MKTYWDAFVDDFPRQDLETDREYLERFFLWLEPRLSPQLSSTPDMRAKGA